MQPEQTAEQRPDQPQPKIDPVQESRILRASGQRVRQKSGDNSANGESLQLKRLLQRRLIEGKMMVPEIPRRFLQVVKYSDPSQLTNQRSIKQRLACSSLSLKDVKFSKAQFLKTEVPVSVPLASAIFAAMRCT